MLTDLTPEKIQAVVAILGMIGGFFVSMASMGYFVWRRIHSFLLCQNKMADALKSQGEVLRNLGHAAEGMREGLITLRTGLEIRQRDHDKLEAKHELTLAKLEKTDKQLERVIANLEAAWATLQNLFPDQVPRRASDRKRFEGG